MQSSTLISVLERSAFLSIEQIRQLHHQLGQRSISVQQAISELASVNTHRLANHCSDLFHLAVISIDTQQSFLLIDEWQLSSLVTEWLAIPVKQHGQWLTLAITDPTHNGVLEAFQFATGLNIDLVLADISTTLNIIDHYQRSRLDEQQALPYQVEAELSTVPNEEELDTSTTTEKDHSTPVGQFVHQVILHALAKRASDIHFEPFETEYRIRMRIDGLLVTTHTPPKKLSRRLVSRIKILSHLNIAERRLPQDGRIKLNLEKQRSIDIRVSTLPTLWGEKIVLRLLNGTENQLSIPQLGLSKQQISKLKQALKAPQGLILITGPTGSGKTTTLYSALQYLNQEQRNISTIEDPIEIQLSGINQIQIHEQIGLKFAPILRSILRQDPDIIMVGEIRDQETAEMAIRAAQTGHLVLSTLHTNSAPETMLRLTQMAIPAYQLTSSVKLVIAQRLVRQLCDHCKVPLSLQIPNSNWYQANTAGCSHCLNGYRGRIGVYDFLSIEPDTPMSQSTPLQITTTTQQDCHLWKHALQLVEQGKTSFSEVTRVITFPSDLSKAIQSDAVNEQILMSIERT